MLQPQQPFIWWQQGVPEKCIEFIGRHQRHGADEVQVAGREGYAYRPFWASSGATYILWDSPKTFYSNFRVSPLSGVTSAAIHGID
jgi:hypothetical protein